MPVLSEGNCCISWVVSLLPSLIGPYSKLEIKILLKRLPIYCIVSFLQRGRRFVSHAKSSDQLSDPTNLPIQWVPGLLRRRQNKGSWSWRLTARAFTARYFVHHSQQHTYTFHTSTYRSEFKISWNFSSTPSICVHRAGTTSLAKQERKYAYHTWHVFVFPHLIVEQFNKFPEAWCELYGTGNHSRTEICIYGVIKKE